MLEQLVRVARVFTRDQIHVFQDLKRAVRDVCKIADRRRNKIKSPRHKTRQDYKTNRTILSNPVSLCAEVGSGYKRKSDAG